MVIYLNEYFQSEEVKDAKIITTYRAVEKVIRTLNNNTLKKVIAVIGRYVWEGGRTNTNRANVIAKKLGFSLAEMVIWYCAEEQC